MCTELNTPESTKRMRALINECFCAAELSTPPSPLAPHNGYVCTQWRHAGILREYGGITNFMREGGWNK
jgi:hypothetical protein